MVDQLWAMCAGAGRGYFLFTFADPDDSFFVPVGARLCFSALVEGQAWDREPSMRAVPMVAAGNHRLHDLSSVLWARVETGESARLLEAFRPRPTLVLRDGQTMKRTALWALHTPLNLDWVKELNRRLQHRFAAPKKFAETDFSFHPPGVFLRWGRSKPLEVWAEHVGDGLYGAREIGGQLPQSPDPEAWAKRNGRARVS